MKLKVLLVDDEYIVLKGLEIMLQNQKETPLEIVTAMDAIDAMDKIDRWYPDVIIADINMPEIDGLSMLEQIAQSHPLCRFIIVSGYEDQAYLMRALKLHVADYLTKPVDKGYLIRRLNEIYEELLNQRRNTLLKIQMMLFQSRDTSSVCPSHAIEKVNLLFPDPFFALCCLPLSSRDAESKKEQVSAYFGSCHIFPQNNWSVFLLNYCARIQEKEIRAIFGEIFPGMDCGISLFTNEEKAPFSLPYFSLYLQESLCNLILSLLPVNTGLKENTASRIALRTLKPAIRVLMFECDISDYISNACDPCKDSFGNFLLIFTESLAAYTLTAGICLPTDTILQLYHSQSETANDRRSMASFLEKTLIFWYDSFTPTEHAAYSSKIATACEYMNAHYTEDISLEQTAEFVSINPSYLSYIFKKETGATFLQYLTNIRLQKACELMLSDPGLSLESVSARTGYHSASYFHKIFRSKFGVSPRQWLLREQKQTFTPPQSPEP